MNRTRTSTAGPRRVLGAVRLSHLTDETLSPAVQRERISGTITGTPTVAGSKSFTTRISDSGGLAINVAGSVAIQPHVSVSTTVLPKAWLNHSYTTTLAAAGGIKPFTWAVVGGALPTGLSLNATTGALTGIGTILGACVLLGRIAIGDWLTILIAVTALVALFLYRHLRRQKAAGRRQATGDRRQ